MKKRGMYMKYLTHSPEQTQELGKKLAANLRPGDIIAFYGDLGGQGTDAWHGRSDVIFRIFLCLCPEPSAEHLQG